MSSIFISQKELSCLRFLTNPLIDEEVAEVLLENADKEIILDIQAVMIIGMEAKERGRDTPWEDPTAVYGMRRRKLPAFDEKLEEIRYLLQPDYKAYLRLGMQVLSIE